ncbi:MAG: hypothetical protein J6D03_05590 [Clostridia bacterium]|nr:hypothetical protein [Clostridia bacterium]
MNDYFDNKLFLMRMQLDSLMSQKTLTLSNLETYTNLISKCYKELNEIENDIHTLNTQIMQEQINQIKNIKK